MPEPMASASFDFNHHSHRRFNPLTNSWVLCSPHRTQRPWQGKEEDDDTANARPSYDPSCYLCPNNTRATAGAIQNPDYKDTFVFENDFPAVRQDQPQLDPSSQEAGNPLLQVESVRGKCHVICFSPLHDKTLADMTELEILPVIQAWISTYESLRKTEFINHVQIFENKGAIMGCSNPHPHGQVWSTEDIPQETAQELRNMGVYKEKYHRCMLCDYVKTETKKTPTTSLSTKTTEGADEINGSAHVHGSNGSSNGSPNGSSHKNGYSNGSTTSTATSASTTPDGSRVVCENASFLCVVPFWATWPFETLVLSKAHLARLSDMSPEQTQDLANILRRITCRYDNLFKCSFPYSMGVHQAPTNGNKEQEALSHLHLHFYPPLLRSATVKKFLVGFELLGQAQRDLTPEQAAKRLADCSEVHYKVKRT